MRPGTCPAAPGEERTQTRMVPVAAGWLLSLQVMSPGSPPTPPPPSQETSGPCGGAAGDYAGGGGGLAMGQQEWGWEQVPVAIRGPCAS